MLALVALCGGGASPAALPPAPVDCGVLAGFPDDSLKDWSEREFKGKSEYALVRDDADGIDVLRGHTDGAASILYRERKVDLRETPILHWAWKVENVYDGIDEKTKGGDDYPARIYVVVKRGLLPWSTLAINYVWSSSLPEGDRWQSPYTDKAAMIAVRSGDALAGRWTCQSRDVAADFREAFGVDVGKLDGYAVMVDGDDGDRSATSFFGDLSFRER